MKLSKEEMETVISFNEADDTAVIYTFSRKWQKLLEDRLGLEPIYKTAEGAREYHLPKSRIPLPRAPRKMSAEQKRNAAERLSKARRQKSSNPLKS